MMKTRFGKLAISLIAVLSLGLLSFGTGLASFGTFDTGIGIFADKGGNNGQGQSDEDHGNNGQGQSDEDHGNNGQGQSDEDHGNNGQGQSDEDHGNNGQGQSDEDHGNNGQGQGDEDVDQDDTDAPGAGEAATPGDASDGNAKVGVCHTTGSESNPAVFIEVSENAVPAHKGHGDEIDVDSPEDCESATGTPGIPGDDDATPEATPVEVDD